MSDLFASLNIADSTSESPQFGATDPGSTPPVKGEFNQLSLGISDTLGGGRLCLKDLRSLFRNHQAFASVLPSLRSLSLSYCVVV